MKKLGALQRFLATTGLTVACLFASQPLLAEEGPLVGSSRRACAGNVTLYLNDTEIWHRNSEEMWEMEDVVIIPDGKKKEKKGILLATLLESVPDIQAVEISTCKGKVRRFEGEKLQAKKDTLYLVITNYRGLKLFNSDGESGRGSRLKNIDQVQLITRPE